MEELRCTVSVKSDSQKVILDDGLINIIKNITNIVDVLYSIQKIDTGGNVNFENFFYEKLIDNLGMSRPYLNKRGKNEINSRIDILKNGNFDILNIPFISDNGVAEFLFGKIISQDNGNKKRYAAAFGVPDNYYNNLVERLDTVLESIHTDIPFYEVGIENDFTDHKSDFRCIDVFSFSGELNRLNKPISLFYSKGQTEILSSLTKVVVFSNVYFSRFEYISSVLGRKYIEDFATVDNLSRDAKNTVLLYWLRGHDTGHFFGKDNLGNEMRDQKFLYYSLHELKSDIISLYILTHFDYVWDEMDYISTDIIFRLFFAEVLRYIRRGGLGIFPDTSSAWLAFNHYLEKGVVDYDEGRNLFCIDSGRIKKVTVDLCETIFDLFYRGDPVAAAEFYNRYINTSNDNTTSFIYDRGIPYYIDLNNF